MMEQKQITQELMDSWITPNHTPKKFVHSGKSHNRIGIVREKNTGEPN